MSQITGPIILSRITNQTLTGRPTAPLSVLEGLDVHNSRNGRRWIRLNSLAGSRLHEFAVDRSYRELTGSWTPLSITADDEEVLIAKTAGTIRLTDLAVGRRITIINDSAGGVVVTNANGSATIISLPIGGSGDFAREVGNDSNSQPKWRCIARGDILDPPSGFPAINTLQGWMNHLDSAKANASAVILPTGIIRINGGTGPVALGSIAAIGADTSGLAAASHSHTLAAITDAGTLAALDSINNSNWSGADLAIEHGGSGASNAADARANFGILNALSKTRYTSTTSGIIPPTGWRLLRVIGCGGGGGGGGGGLNASTSAVTGGGGGQGGQGGELWFHSGDLAGLTSFTATIGSGGNGGAGRTGAAGNGSGTAGVDGGSTTLDAVGSIGEIANFAGGTRGNGGSGSAAAGGSGGKFQDIAMGRGSSSTSTGTAGAASRGGQFGGGGGGAGGSYASGGTVRQPGVGGSSFSTNTTAVGGGGAAGTSGASPTAGNSGSTTFFGGSGGGGGGSCNAAGVSAANGGNGVDGGGGGGGGAWQGVAASGTNAGSGGNGGNGWLELAFY